MKLEIPKWIKQNGWLILGIVAVVLFLAYYAHEQFQNYAQTDMAAVCGSRTSCSSCLTPLGSDGETGNCGWCPTAKKCVPKVGPRMTKDSMGGSRSVFYPVVGANSGITCPIDEFIDTIDKCNDFECGTIKNCRDCAQSLKCGWCDTTNTCLARDVLGGTKPAAAGATGGCDAAGAFLTSTAKCPLKACEDITSCEECAVTAQCGYCVKSEKCLKIVRDNIATQTLENVVLAPTNGGSVQVTVGKNLTYKPDQLVEVKTATNEQYFVGLVESYAKNTGVLKLKTISGMRGNFGAAYTYQVRLNNEEQLETCGADGVPVTSPTQCPGSNTVGQLGSISAKAEVDRSRDVSLAQSSLLDADTGSSMPMATQALATDQLGAVKPPPASTTIIGAPGVTRRIGASGARSTYPAAAPAPVGEEGPFEQYIQMLVRSELASQGVPTAEPFSVGDVIQNAGLAMERSVEGVMREGGRLLKQHV